MSLDKKNPIQAFIIIFFRGVATLTSVGVNVIIARLLGPSGSGNYFIFTSWQRLVEGLFSGGHYQYTTRKIALSTNSETSDENKNFILNIVIYVLLVTTFCLLIIWIVSNLYNYIIDVSFQKWTIVYGALIAGSFFAVVKIFSSAIKGLKYPKFSIALEFNIFPIFLLSLLLFYYLTSYELTLYRLIITYCILAILASVIGLLVWSVLEKVRISWIRKIRLVRKDEILNTSIYYFWTITIIRVISLNLPFYLLPLLVTSEDIGLFGIAQRLVAISSTILVALSSLFNPSFAQDFKWKDFHNLKRDLKLSQIYSIIAYLPFLVIFIFFSDRLLGFFGSEFVAATPLLWIMAFGQMINSSTGLSGHLLNMIEKENTARKIWWWTLVITFILIIVLGNWYYIYGVAAAFALGNVIRNILFFTFARSYINTFCVD
ncbi:MAG: hypothetical protein H8E13_08895 [Actinobacteria bacterium]|nr:hypothetical protein [Actinomycetota bacterium]